MVQQLGNLHGIASQENMPSEGQEEMKMMITVDMREGAPTHKEDRSQGGGEIHGTGS
jgi:hypothetical protein